MRDRGYQPGLDGVRGVAILLVLGQHAPTRPLIDGFVGVTVFFCLSGYLITTLLVRQLHTGTIDVRAFYRRRAARLCPALVTVVAVTIVVLLDRTTRPQCRAGPRTRRRSRDLHDQPLRLDRPRLRHQGLLQLHLVALGRGAVLPAVAVRAALGLSPQSSVVRRAHRVVHRGHPGARPLPRPEPRGAVRPARVLRQRHERAAHPGRLLARDRRAQRVAVADDSVSRALCAAGPRPPALPGVSERHLSPLPGDRRGDRTDARDADRCRDPAAIGGRVAAGKQADAVAGRTVVLDLPLERAGADRRPQPARTHAGR